MGSAASLLTSGSTPSAWRRASVRSVEKRSEPQRRAKQTQVRFLTTLFLLLTPARVILIRHHRHAVAPKNFFDAVFPPDGSSSSFWRRSRFSCVSNMSCKSSFLRSTARAAAAANRRDTSQQKNQQNNAEPMLKFFFFWMFYAPNSSLKGNWILLQLGSCSIFIVLANISVTNSPSLLSLQRH